jgi:hypothetical protein
MDIQMARQGNKEWHYVISFAKRNTTGIPDVEFKVRKLGSEASLCRMALALDCDKCPFDKLSLSVDMSSLIVTVQKISFHSASFVKVALIQQRISEVCIDMREMIRAVIPSVCCCCSCWCW